MLLTSLLLASFACPSGTVRFVDSAAAADYTVRIVGSETAADCVVRWVRHSPRTGEWVEMSGLADFTVYRTSGIADFTVHFRP